MPMAQEHLLLDLCGGVALADPGGGAPGARPP